MESSFRALGAGLIVLAVSIGLSDCGTVPKRGPVKKDGEIYGVVKGAFRHRWWNYYERALSFADGGFLKEAELDLLEAIRQRPEDQRRARTYGLHFTDYFPHRELGVVYFGQGRIDEAVRELNDSLNMEQSSKARFYLDKARKSLIERDGLDRRAPQIVIRAPVEGHLTKDFTVNISGLAKDDTFVRRITVGGLEVRIDVSNEEIPFSIDVPVDPGENQIIIKAVDLSGKSAEHTLRVNVDRMGPGLRIDSPVEGGSITAGGVAIKGGAFDDSKITELFINGHKIPVEPKKELVIDKTVPIPSGGKELEIKVKDAVGNTTSAVIPLAGAGEKPVQIETDPEVSDAIAPVVRIRGMETERTTYLDQAIIEANVRDNAGLKRVTINDLSIGPVQGKNVYFSRLAWLEKGENIITIRAEDMAGNVSEFPVRIKRDVLKVHETESRLRIAVDNFKRETIGEDKKLSFGIEEIVTSAMIDHSRFSVVNRRELKKILEELQLSQSGLVEESKALDAGKILSADCMLFGSILERINSLEIYARLVDVETTEVLAAADLYGENVDIDLLRTLGRGIDLKLSDKLPVVEGIVVQVKGDKIVMDIGKKLRVKTGMKVIVFKIGEQVKHPVTGKIIGTGLDELGRARIDSVMEDMSTAELMKETVRSEVQPMMNVITR